MMKATVRRGRRRLAGFVLLCAVAGCGDGGGGPTVEPPRAAAAMEVVSGAGQEAEVGTELPQPLVVLVKDADGRPLQGAIVEWSSPRGGSPLAGLPSATDAAGRAEARWTLGTAAGADSVVARVKGSTVETRIGVRARPGAPARLMTVPASVSLLVFNEFGRFLEAVLADRYGNLIGQPAVEWTSLDVQHARVEPEGAGFRVVPVSPGLARIQARSGVFADTLPVEVWHDVRRVELTPFRLRAVVGDSILFSAVGRGTEDVLRSVPVSWAITTGQGLALQPTESSSGPVVPHARAVGRAQAPGTVKVAATPVWAPHLVATVQIEIVEAGDSWASVEAGEVHGCGLAAGGRGWCWGGNFNNQLATDAPDTCGGVPCNTTPMPIRGGYTFASLAPGGSSTCGLTTAGQALCWGDNLFGQLGDGAPTNLTVRQPVPVTGGHAFVRLALGSSHTCGLDGAGRAFCWGNDHDGQLGVGGGTSPIANPVPLPVAGGLAFRHLAADHQRTCGITTAGETYCWGIYIGNSPRRVADAPEFVQLAVGWLHTCGLTAAGDAYCWGINEAGELGLGRTDLSSESVPRRVNGGHRFTSITTGWRFTCGVTVDGAAYCWGSDENGKLGNGGANVQAGTPTPVAGGHAFRSVTAGRDYACALGTDGRVYCWGYGYAGVLGNGTRDDSSVPTPVSAP